MANTSLSDFEEQHDKFRALVRDLKKIKQEENLANLDDNMLFDGAVRIYNSLLINKNVKQKTSAADKNAEEAPMTEKQRKLLQNLGYRGHMNLSKQEAIKLIQESLENQKEAR